MALLQFRRTREPLVGRLLSKARWLRPYRNRSGTTGIEPVCILKVRGIVLLTGRPERDQNLRRRRSFAVAMVVCLVLLALLAVLQVAHVHPLETDADHCPLCIAMHAVAPVVVAVAMILLIQVGTPALVLEPRSVLRQWHPSLFTRPPPPASSARRFCLHSAPVSFRGGLS